MKYKLLHVAIVLLLAANVVGKERKVAATTPSLFKEIALQDSLMFAAFNTQNMPAFKAYFSTGLEWFQDNGGLIGYDTVFINFASTFAKPYKLTRKLVKGSLEVHPIKDYGAIEIGKHQFRHMENGKEEVGTFKFLMIWKKQNGNWQITRVVSYDH